MILLEIKFEINLFSFVAFLAGMFAGFALLGLLYLIGCLSSLKKKAIRINKEIANISEEEIKQTIFKYQEAFSDEKNRRKTIPFDYFRTAVIEMIQEIAGKFYPKSKRPLTELSLNELILLDRYIVNKIDELLSRKGLSLFRGLKLSTIMRLVDTKTAVDKNTVVKTVKRYRLKEIVGIFTAALNFINPYFWFKRLIINPSINILLSKMCLICFSIIGQETYNVYSKQAFVEEDPHLQELLKSLEKEGEAFEKEGIVIENQVSEEIVDSHKKKKS